MLQADPRANRVRNKGLEGTILDAMAHVNTDPNTVKDPKYALEGIKRTFNLYTY